MASRYKMLKRSSASSDARVLLGAGGGGGDVELSTGRCGPLVIAEYAFCSTKAAMSSAAGVDSRW